MGTAKTKAQNKYLSKTYDSLRVVVRKDSPVNKEVIQNSANLAGESLNSYIVNAVGQRIERENAKGDEANASTSI